MARWTFALPSDVATILFFDEPTNACWFCTKDGHLRAVRLLGGALQDFGGGWNNAVAAFPSIDGLTVLVIEASGDLYVAPRNGTSHADAAIAASVGNTVQAATRLRDGDVLVLDSAGRIHRVSLAGDVQELTEGVVGSNLFVVDEVADELLCVVSASTSNLHRFKLSDGSAIGTPVGIAMELSAIATSPYSAGLVVADAAGSVSGHNWSGPPDSFTFSLPEITALTRWHSLMIAAVGDALELVEWGDDFNELPVTAGFDPLVPGGWAPLMVDYDAAGFRADEIEWLVDEGSTAGAISVARPLSHSPGKYEHRVLAGFDVPELKLTASVRATGKPVASRRFRVVRHWPDAEIGPPMSVTGSQNIFAKPGWGGGPAGPQNINIHPAPSEIRMAAAVFRTKGENSSVDAQQRVNQLKEDIVGSGQSARTYYEEVSYRATPASTNPAHPKGSTVTLLGDQVFGPIDLDYSWADLFEHPNPDDTWGAWHPKGGTWDVLAGTFSTFLLDLGLADSVTRLADTVLLTVLPGTDDPYTAGDKEWPAQWTWAFGGDAQIYWKGPSWATFKRIPAIVMPAALPASHPAPWTEPEFTSTIIHELGHNLGCPDLYNYGAYPAEAVAREVSSWDIMNEDVPLNHFSLANRMRLGWVNPDWIEVCDFGQNPASRTVKLHAIEAITRSGPPPGSRAGVEIRIRDGWNYYFEYRSAQSHQLFDKNLPSPTTIFGSDVFLAGADDIARALILKLPVDLDGDGPELLSMGQDYEESDVTNPDRMNDFRLTRQTNATPGNPNDVTVRIDYVGAHRPELQITPAPGRGNFKSPDIDVDGPAGPNIAVKGKTNTIKLRVHNRGTKAADQVRVRVQWLPFTSAPGPWKSLESPPTQAIPPHSTREFSVSWPLAASVQVADKEAEHFCVRVDIDRYVDPTDPAGNEIVVHNNWAQSNFSTSAVGHGSPSERRTTPVSATNVLPMRAIHRTLIEQSGEAFRAYVDHAWRRLNPGQTDVTELAYESLAGDPLHDRDFQAAFQQAEDRGLVNNLLARTFAMPERRSDGPVERWGVQLRVRAGIRTYIERVDARGELVSGIVSAGNPEKPQRAQGGKVRMIGWATNQPELQFSSDGSVDPDGEFRVLVPGELLQLATSKEVLVVIFYHGTARFTPCTSPEVTLRQ